MNAQVQEQQLPHSAPPSGRRTPARLRSALPTRILTLVAAVALLVAAATFSLLIGVRSIALADIWAGISGNAVSSDAVVIATQRLPRTIVALCAGLALGAAGALMQGHTRNPLADPGLFGVNAGAAFGVVALAFVIGPAHPSLTVFAALAGAALATLAVFAVGRIGNTANTPVTLALAGAAMGAFLSAATTLIMLLDQQSLDIMRVWSVGSVAARNLDALPLTVAVMLASLALALVNAAGLNALSLGDDVAHSLGAAPERVRAVGIVAITLLAGGATALCGPLGFVGLVVPHIARLVVASDQRWLVPLSALLGGAFLLLADTAGRLVIPGGELQAGLMTAAAGAPVLIAIVLRKRVRSL